MIILNNITKERVSISLLDNQTTITRDYDLEENKSKSFLITYLDEHTIIEDLQTNRKTYFIYDKNNKIHSVLTRDNYLEYYRYDSFKLLEKSRSLALKKTDNHNLIQNHDFSNGLQSWTALKATPSVLDNTTASNYIYNKMVRLSYNGELYQDINVKGTSLDSLTLAFLYSNCDSGDFSIKASIILTPTKDGEEMIEENVLINDIDNSNSKYLFHVMDLHATKSFKKIRVKFTCLGSSCFISGVYLLKRSSITKMEYDDDGVLFSISHDGRIIKTNKDEDGKILGGQINDRYFNLSKLDNEETLLEEYGVKVITTKDEYDRVIKRQITSGNNRSVQEIFYNGDELTKITDHIFEESYK